MQQRDTDDLARGALEPGDRRIRAVVRLDWAAVPRFMDEPTCTRCRRVVDVDAGWTVLFGTPDVEPPDRLLVCDPCGIGLTPFRLVLDVERLRSAPPDDAFVGTVARMVLGLVRARFPSPTRRITIRAGDVIALAHMLDTTRTHLAMRLHDTGVLLDVEGSISAGVEPPTV